MRKILYFLGKLSDADVDWLAAVGRRQVVRSGTALVTEGEPLDSLFFVLDGRFRVTAGGSEIGELSCGEVVGELSFLDAHPPSASVSALEASAVLAVPKRDLAARLARDPGFPGRFYHAVALFLATRLRRMNELQRGSAGKAVEIDDLGAEALDDASIAGARFDWLLRRLAGSAS